MTLVLIISAAVSGILLFLIVRLTLRLRHFKEKYKDIIDVDDALAKKNDELKESIQSIDRLKSEYDSQKEQLNLDFTSKRTIYEDLLKEMSVLEENLENISYGLYSPHFDYNTSDEFKQQLENVRERQKQIIRDELATHCPVKWEVSGSKAEGKRMTKHYSKLMLRAFNGECDAAIARVSWSNIGNMEARIEKAFEAINKLGVSHQITVTKEYHELKVEELRLEFELEEKLHNEKEEQRKIREQMREEEKAQREM